MNSTSLTTIFGLISAAGVAAASYLSTNSMDGGATKQPTFWLGLVVAVALGLKGYYTQGTPPKV